MSPEKELRETRQRALILEELRGTRTHPTADELYRLVKRRLPRISLGTVYRNLELLSERGVIQKLPWGGGQGRFDGDTSRHLHVRCACCGRVADVRDGPPVRVTRAFKDKNGWEITGCRLDIVGLCPQCRERR